jgi:hypothetical protein
MKGVAIAHCSHPMRINLWCERWRRSWGKMKAEIKASQSTSAQFHYVQTSQKILIAYSRWKLCSVDSPRLWVPNNNLKPSAKLLIRQNSRYVLQVLLICKLQASCVISITMFNAIYIFLITIVPCRILNSLRLLNGLMQLIS